MNSLPEKSTRPKLRIPAKGNKRPRCELLVYPLFTPAGAGWIGLAEGKISWLSIGPLDLEDLRKYWSGEIRQAECGPFDGKALEEALKGNGQIQLLPRGTPFQLKVWKALLKIPPGSTVTYGELSEMISGNTQSARAVGSAVGANPIAWLIPCHRVLPAGGGLGGFRWGAQAKARLLESERNGTPLPAPEQETEDKRKLEALLLNAQRFEDIAKLAGDIAHDLNNLLAPIRMATELLKRKLEDRTVDRYVEIIENSTGRARAVIQEILSFSKESESAECQLIDVNEVLQELEKMARETFPSTLSVDFVRNHDAPKVRIDPHQLHRSILNLLVNARDAVADKGRIQVRVSLHDLEMRVCVGKRCLIPGHYVCISVSDDGCGIPLQLRDRIFDPFFTTKPKEKGTGLGLASVFGIIARAGGFIDLESIEGKGSSFHVFLPEAKE